MALAGFSAALGVAAYFVFLLWFRFRQTASWMEFVLYSITFLLLFDSSAFTFTPLKLRIWYPLLLLGLYLNYQHRRALNVRVPMVGSVVGRFLVMFYVAFSTLWLFWDQADGRLSNLKYLLFAVGLVVYYRATWFTLDRERRLAFWRFVATLSVFVSLWGFLQLGFNTVSPWGPRFQLDWFNVRPSAFFSETTWYAEYCLLGFFVVLYLIGSRAVSPAWVIYCFPLLSSLVISNTRNAFVGLGVGLFALAFLSIFRRKREKVPLWNPWTWGVVGAGALALLAVAVFASGELGAQVQRIAQRFTGGDPSSLSRLEAFDRSLSEFASGWFTGQGYSWYPEQGTAAGTYTGSKNFNLLLMVGYIFGWSGLAVFVVACASFVSRALRNYFVHDWLESKYGVVLFGVFFLMSMFTPVHQFPFGLMVFGLATVMHRRADA